MFLYIENGGGRGSGMASWAADCTCRSIAKDVYGKPIPVQVTNCLSNDGTRRSAVSTFKRWAREVAGK